MAPAPASFVYSKPKPEMKTPRQLQRADGA